MEPEGSLHHSQEPTTCPYPETDQPNLCPPPSYLLKIYFNIASHLCLGLLSELFPSGFPTKTLHTPFLSPIHATFSDRFILLGVITQIIFGEEYRQ